MISLRTHYLISGKARCGQHVVKNWTVDPAQVTCENCKKLLGRELQS